jgi:methyl-accepting chemotaxis protein
MPQGPPKRRFLTLLRRTARSAQVTVAGRSAAEETALWNAHDRALAASRDASGAAQRIAQNVGKQRSAVDGVADRARTIATRAQDVSSTFSRVVDVFERLALIALNAGLEGARLGENEGKALLLVSDEVRAHATRGGETARDMAGALAEVSAELAQLNASIGPARDITGEVAQEAARVAGSCADGEAALVELAEKLRKTTGSDPETVKAITETAENARALVSSLTALSGKVPRNLLLSALRPALDPLARLLADEEVEGPEDEGGE